MWPERPFELGRNTCAVTPGGTSQLQDRVMFVCVKTNNDQWRCQSLHWLHCNTSMLRCETTKHDVTTLYWLCRKTTMLLCENY